MADLFIQAIEPPQAPTGRSGPRLWIRRLVIFSDPDTIIRDVTLRPGLNIIWSPDMSSGESRALAHGSGKTTFCRLLRACLGEPGFASETQTRRIMSRLPNGKIACEVMVDGKCWVAVRSLGLPGSDFVIEANRAEDALARGRQEGDPVAIDSIIAAAFLSKIVGAAPPEVGDDHVWDVLRAWLTRDQECRLSDILAWRSSHTHSRSRAQVLGETSKLTMVRLALRALDAEERTAALRERELMAAAEKPTGGEYTHELHSTTVGSALAVAASLPALYDQIYEQFPTAYNDGGAGRFGRLTSVKMASDMRTKPTSTFTKKPVSYSYPDGFIMPLVYGLKALMTRVENGHVEWVVDDPAAFVEANLVAIVRKYRVIIDAFAGDPQKIGKNEGSYALAFDAFETELLKLRQSA